MRIILFWLLFFYPYTFAKDFNLVDLSKIAPKIQIQMKYYGVDNFVGKKISGYKANKCLLTAQAARALARAQKLANQKGYTLLVFDCYRPQQAVDHFVRWSKSAVNPENKQKYFPAIEKKELFKLGYIASKSGHSRASTVDLTLVNSSNNTQLEMGTIFDFFDKKSHTNSTEISKKQKKNRVTLLTIMKKANFRNYSKEWWHYTLNDEPNKSKYLNIPIN